MSGKTKVFFSAQREINSLFFAKRTNALFRLQIKKSNGSLEFQGTDEISYSYIKLSASKYSANKHAEKIKLT